MGTSRKRSVLVKKSKACRLALACILLAFASSRAPANSDALIGVLSGKGDAGLGVAWRFEHSVYRGAGLRYDFVPLYLYEGDYLYLHAYRIGLKLDRQPDRRFDVFLSHRFESFPYDRIPASLAGMAVRGPGVDAGVSYRRSGKWGNLYAEFLRDVSGASQGNELRLGYNYERRSGNLSLKPSLALEQRSAGLNDYYYGVRSSEGTALRPAYDPGAGMNAVVGLYAQYNLTERWRLLTGLSATRWAGGVRRSPIVDDRTQLSAFLGFAYDFALNQPKPWQEGTPLLFKVLHGKSTDCNLVPVMRLSCTSTKTDDQTAVTSIEIGRPFVEGLNDWPLDVVGYVGLLRHHERDLQQDTWQLNAYMKAFYYGFPWRDRVRTRIGFGIGVSYAQKVPFVEMRDQLRRGRNASKLLNYLDPSIDVSVGDLLRVKALRETYFGFGVSHRSGIFGTSQLLGNVDGGSNYIYSYVEARF